MLLGKFKRFHIDRYLAILDFFVNLMASETQEAELFGHSIELLAVVNSLADEGLLKRDVMKRSGSNIDDLSSVTLRCNFDQNFIKEVARKICFPLEEFII